MSAGPDRSREGGSGTASGSDTDSLHLTESSRILLASLIADSVHLASLCRSQFASMILTKLSLTETVISAPRDHPIPSTDSPLLESDLTLSKTEQPESQTGLRKQLQLAPFDSQSCPDASLAGLLVECLSEAADRCMQACQPVKQVLLASVQVTTNPGLYIYTGIGIV
ncbi:unnamed protein product [Protopolystoma xenopodis]|uniref:Uncharacterized protein n=1 Tax=Protopolystoma xenopodis TaxID=117903 RepID=A0A3S5ANW6_9PLAT|nr:unnamed protein product [Protopolystoma xenopodis]